MTHQVRKYIDWINRENISTKGIQIIHPYFCYIEKSKNENTFFVRPLKQCGASGHFLYKYHYLIFKQLFLMKVKIITNSISILDRQLEIFGPKIFCTGLLL